MAGNRAVAAMLQRTVAAASFSELLEHQKRDQELEKEFPGQVLPAAVTTVGFEHEFAQMEGDDLAGVTHLELVRSLETLPFTGLPFMLETDADNALELVSPPFLVETQSATEAIPDLADVRKIDGLMKTRLTAMIADEPTLTQLAARFRDDPGLTFSLSKVDVQRKNVTSETKKDYHAGATEIKPATLGAIKVKPSEKGTVGHAKTIGSQVNFATTAEVYDRMQRLAPAEEPGGHEAAFAELEGRLRGLLFAAHARIPVPRGSDKVPVFLRIVARALSGQLAVQSIEARRERQKKLFDEQSKEERDRRRPQLDSPGGFDRSMASHVKDVGGSWLKDNLWNAGIGLLTPADWGFVHTIVTDQVLVTAVGALQPQARMFPGKAKDQEQYSKHFPKAKQGIDAALTLLGQKSLTLSNMQQAKLLKEYVQPQQPVEFLGHVPQLVGARQDTYIGAKNVQMPGQWPGQRLHVVETRGAPMRSLEWLEADKRMRTTDQTDAQIAADFTDVTEKDVKQMRERAIRELAAGNGLPPMAPAAIALALHVNVTRVNQVLAH